MLNNPFQDDHRLNSDDENEVALESKAWITTHKIVPSRVVLNNTAGVLRARILRTEMIATPPISATPTAKMLPNRRSVAESLVSAVD